MKRYAVAIACLIWAIQIQAQSDASTFEDRIESQRVAFITDRVDLSVQEAQSFWPLYNVFRKTEKELNKQKNPGRRIASFSEDEAQIFIEKTLAVDQELLNLRHGFVDDLSAILSAQKIVRFWQSERAFKERLVQMLKKRRNSGR